MKELSVVVPCLNEEANLPDLVARVGEVFQVGNLDGELVLIDDGSTDSTWKVIGELEQANPWLSARRHSENRGIDAGWTTGVSAARGKLVAILDADLQYQPEDLLRLKRELEVSNVDIVQGWRSPVGRAKDSRYYYSRGLNHLLNVAFGMNLRDNKSGFVVTRREILEDLLTYRGGYAYWQSFIMVAAHAKGYTYKEVETLFEPRRAGKSFLDNAPVKAVARSFVDIAKAMREYRMKPQTKSTLRPFLDREPPMMRESPQPIWRKLWFDGYLQLFGVTHWMMTKEVSTQLRDLQESQWLTPAKTRELQEHKLRR